MFNKYFARKPAFAALDKAVWLVLIAFFVSVPDLARADALQSLGGVMCNIVQNLWPFGKFCEYTAYVAGCVCAVQGIHHFRMHSEDPRNAPLRNAVMLWFGAMCLLALPSVIDTVVTSLYEQPATGGALTCTAGAVGGGGQSLDLMMSSFVGNIYAPMIAALSLLAIICGLFMIVRGFMKASKYGLDPRTHTVTSILANIVFGALLFTIGDNLNVMMASVFGSSDVTDPAAISWTFANALAGGASAQFQNAIAAALHFVQLIGIIAFVRGWLIMKKVVEGGGQNTMAQGITHILGGVLAINIALFLQILDNTFGTGLLGG